MYPDRDTLGNVSRSGYITARDQSVVGSGVTEGGKTLPVFFFVNEHSYSTTTETLNRELKSNDFQSYPGRETAASGGKRCR